MFFKHHNNGYFTDNVCVSNFCLVLTVHHFPILLTVILHSYSLSGRYASLNEISILLPFATLPVEIIWKTFSRENTSAFPVLLLPSSSHFANIARVCLVSIFQTRKSIIRKFIKIKFRESTAKLATKKQSVQQQYHHRWHVVVSTVGDHLSTGLRDCIDICRVLFECGETWSPIYLPPVSCRRAGWPRFSYQFSLRYSCVVMWLFKSFVWRKVSL